MPKSLYDVSYPNTPTPAVPAWLKFWRGVTPWQEEQGQTFPLWAQQKNIEWTPPAYGTEPQGLWEKITEPGKAYMPMERTPYIAPIEKAWGTLTTALQRTRIPLLNEPSPYNPAAGMTYEEYQKAFPGQTMIAMSTFPPYVFAPGGGEAKGAKAAGEIAPKLIEQATKFAGKYLARGESAENIIRGIGKTFPEVAPKAREIVEGMVRKLGISVEQVAPKIPEVAPKVGGIVPPTRVTSTTPLGEGALRESEHFRKVNERLGGELGDNPLYNQVNLADQAKKAIKFVSENPDDARKIALGLKNPPEGLLDTAISTAYEQRMFDAGDLNEFTKVVNSLSLRKTRAGQEIAALRGVVSDTSPTHFVEQVIAERVNRVGNKLPKGITPISPQLRVAKAVNKEVEQLTKVVNSKKVDISEAQKLIDSLGTMGDRLKVAFKNGELTIDGLYNMTSAERRAAFEHFSNPEAARTLNAKFERAMLSKQKDALQNWARSITDVKKRKTVLDKINELEKMGALDTESTNGFLSDLVASKLGIEATPGEVAKIKSLSEGLEELSTKFDPVLEGVEDLPYWKARNELENYVRSLTPTHQLKVATSLIGRGMMLMSFKSPIVNMTSNTVHGTVQMLERRLASRAWTGMNLGFWKTYILKDMEIYNKTGYGLSRMDKLWTGQRRLGEEIVHAQGAGGIRKVGRFMEDVVFDKMMGAPDEYASAFAFADSASTEIARIVKQEGLTGEAAMARHLELSKKVINVKSTGDALVDTIRAKAISDARVATWTNEGNYSRLALNIRNGLNKISRDIMLGDQLMPFVKTPANIVEISLDSAGLGFFKAIYKSAKSIKTGDAVLMQEAVRDATRAGIGLSVALVLAYSLNPEDFTPPYEACTSKEREMAALKNAPYNSVKLGDKYISLDYFGALGAPFVGIMMARKATEQGKGLPEAIGQYGRGAAQQVVRIPGIQEVGELATGVSTAFAQPDIGKTGMGVANTFGSFIKSRGIPAILGDIAAGVDPYQRQIGTSAWNQTIATIPGWRQTLPPKVERVTGEVMPTEGFISTLLFGSRIKTGRDNAVISEIDRLYGAGAAPTIANIENSSKLVQKLKAEIGEDRFIDALQFYGISYGNKASQEMGMPSYRQLSDEDKMKRLNSLRSDAVDEMILKYQKTEIVKPPSLQTQLNHAFYQIENNIWTQYPPNLRTLSDQIITLENSDNRNDKIQARQLLMEHPEILSIRRKISLEKARMKREMQMQGVGVR